MGRTKVNKKRQLYSVIVHVQEDYHREPYNKSTFDIFNAFDCIDINFETGEIKTSGSQDMQSIVLKFTFWANIRLLYSTRGLLSKCQWY